MSLEARSRIEARSRMISFRLSAEEYERFRDLCFAQGANTVSEMARAAINLLLQEPSRASRQTLESRVAQLEGQISSLCLEIKRLSATRASDGLTEAASLISEWSREH